MQKRNVIYCYPRLSSFIQKDLDILDKHYTLVSHEFKPEKGALIILRFFGQLFFLLKHLPSADMVICRFLGYHSFLPLVLGKLLGKPRLSIIGGTESHNYPSIQYGSLRKKVYAWFTRVSFSCSSHIAPVHHSLVYWQDAYYARDFPCQGYTYFFPEMNLPFTEIFNGYDANSFYPVQGVKRKPNSFITVALDFSGGEFYRKGVDLIIEAARAFPQYSFTIIGKTTTAIPELPNLNLIAPVPNKELPAYFSAHEFYMQLSIAEGFPNALCEAMLCGCIPVASAVYGIPEIVNSTGFLLKKHDTQQLVALFREASTCDKVSLSQMARERIKNEFSIERREKKLIALLNQLMTR